ncbi:hypothetical protein DIS24_g5088 [Lasiodiplodia hormozganensis]|uniref:Uncharacterized protein n=1 Tax=Lasiodiplodia hormozganensis TaxID=869390 RepID=A0AA40CZD0_9PEZI|nr:hypothetical protein DIS24_g5088 [Lasiodiplodia hormozganensis]
MAPRIVQGNAAARPRPHFSTKPESTVHASDMFKNFTQRATTARSKAAPPTKYDLTSKPQGITKNRSQGRNPILREREKRRSKPEHPLSTLFTETASSYRNTVIENAQDALFAARRSLLHRLTSINGPGNPHSASPTSPTNHIHPSPTPNRLPTTTELQAAHNALVAKVIAPFGETKVIRGGKGKLEANEGKGKNGDAAVAQHEQPLSERMAAFAAVVAREEKNLRQLGEKWMQTRAEIRLLAEGIFGQGAVKDMMRGKKMSEEVKEVGRGLGEGAMEALKRAAEELVKQGEVEAEAVREEEKRVRREQKKAISAALKKIQDL